MMFSHSELIGSLKQDLNAMLKLLFSGEYLSACVIITGMAQKLINLETGIDNDLKNREETIEQLKEELRLCGREIIDVPIEYGKEAPNE